MGSYDLSSPLAIKAAAEAANIKAHNEPNQDSYNAAWLHGYASALRETAEQLAPMQRLVNEVLNYLGEHNDQSRLYEMLHDEIGMRDDEIEFLGFEFDCIANKQDAHAISPDKGTGSISITSSTPIKNWYLAAYSTDSLGGEIREGFTFGDALQTLQNKACIYEALGVCDSVIRERVFDQLAKINNVDYNVIYDMWCNEKIPLLNQIQSASDRAASPDTNIDAKTTNHNR